MKSSIKQLIILFLIGIFAFSACLSSSPVVKDTPVDSATVASDAVPAEPAANPVPEAFFEDEMQKENPEEHFLSAEESGTGEYITDPDAEADWFVRNTVLWGYYVSFNVDMTSATFRDPDNHRINYATYDLVKQGWVFKGDKFEPAGIDLTKLYSKISLTHDQLDRLVSDFEERQSVDPKTVPGYKGVPQAVATRAADLKRLFGYIADIDAVNRQDLTGDGIVLWGYKITQPNKWYPNIYFRKVGKEGGLPDASFNWCYQHWQHKMDDFDSSKIDLAMLFEKVTLTHSEMDRYLPNQVIALDLNSPTPFVQYLADDLTAFINACRSKGVSDQYIDFYTQAAKVSGKRGSVVRVPYGSILNMNEVGIQAGAFHEEAKPQGPLIIDGKPVAPAGALPEKRESIFAGGLQYYFEMRKLDQYKIRPGAQGIVSNSSTVALRVVELDHINGSATPGILRGAELARAVEQDIEYALGKDVSVSSERMTIDYDAFADAGNNSLLFHYDKYLKDHVNSKYGNDAVYIYYFTDKDRLLAIDQDGAHPVSWGAYATDWNNRRYVNLHELGHSFGLRHHFSGRMETWDDPEHHISVPCIMNYTLRGDTYCPLCRYGLMVADLQ